MIPKHYSTCKHETISLFHVSNVIINDSDSFQQFLAFKLLCWVIGRFTHTIQAISLIYDLLHMLDRKLD